MREKYRLKINKKAFLFPDQWRKFYDSLKEKQQPYFKIAINTGARINEIRHLQVQHIDFKDFERKNLIFYTTKIRAKKKETRPEPRPIPISTEFREWLARWIRKHKLSKTSTFNIPSTVAIAKILHKNLAKVGVENWQDFSSHNIRKTHGNWLKAIGIDGTEIATRLGHDMNTLLKAYVSPNIFSESDKILIRRELGDLYLK